MLRNVAIPLMLAATEAEGQKFSDKQVKEAMQKDRDEFFKGLVADEAACTVASDADISTKAGTVSDAKQAYDDAVKAVDDLEAGAWGDADTARKEAVAAAEAAENETNVAGLLDALDSAAGAERAAAAAYAVADNAYNAGVLAKQIADQADSDTNTEAGRLEGLKNDAIAAKTAANDQHAKETLWREWLYCELGAVVAGDPNNSETDWWKMIASDSSISSANAAPGFCTVPAVKKTAATHQADVTACAEASPGYDDSGDANYATLKNTYEGCITQRPAIRYYSAMCTSTCATDGSVLEGSATDTYAQFQAREKDVVATATVEAYWQRWTATLAHTTATTLQDAVTNYQGLDRNAQGKVNWQIGDLKAKQWIEQQRKREHDFYNGMQTLRGSAAGVANSMSTGAAYDVPDPSPGYGLTANAAGAKKALDTAATNRDAATAGVKTMPQARTGGSGNTWLSSWTALDDAQMKVWNDANSSAGAVSLWWAAARALSEAVAAWDAAYGAGTGITSTQNWSAATKTLTAADVASGAGGDGPCVTNANSSNGGIWGSNSDTQGAADISACASVCTTINGASGVGVLYDGDTKDGGGTVTTDRGGNIRCQFNTPNPSVAYYCGGYSFDNGAANAADKCKILWGAADPGQGAADVASSKCAKIEPSTQLAEFYALQKAVSTKYAAITSTLTNNMTAAIATQVDLEKAWLEAWYVQQYWAAINTELTVGTSGSMAETIQGFVTTLEGNAAQGRASKLGAEADANSANTSLTNAQSDLAALQANVTSAQANVTEISSRILKAGVELAELRTLAAADGTSGKLDAQVTKRTADHAAYVNDGSVAQSVKGPRQLAIEAKAAADPPVAARSGTQTVAGTDDADGGALLEARFTKQAEWTAAEGAATEAENNLTAAIPLADGSAGTIAANQLTELREAVTQATSTWTDQNTDLTQKIGTVASTLETLEEAQKAQDDAVLACQIAAYDAYRTTLEEEMVARANKLKEIKALLEDYEEPAPGTAGARCEKALSNGTWRPARGEQTCDEGLCCGAARVWMSAGVGGGDNAWMTIETCQTATDTTYAYKAPRAPMSTSWSDPETVPFMCIEGAHKLAAAASAVAAAVYMLA